MRAAKSKEVNPLGMRQLEEGGPFVLSPTLCSARRVEFLRRGNIILGFYSTIAIASKKGQDIINQAEKKGELGQDTPIRIDMRPGGEIIQTNYGLFKKQFVNAGVHLTNQVFLMLYGNFEAYLADLVLDALTHTSSHPDPYE